MKKLGFQFIVILACFFALWKGLATLPWTEWLKIHEFTKEKQEQVGRWVIKSYRIQKEESDNDTLKLMLNNIKDRICLANDIDTASLKVYLFEDKEVNAFAIPYQQIIFNTALLEYCDNADMVAGVMAHEIAHIEQNHINKKLAKEVGIASVVMLTGDNFGVITKILTTLSSTHFDREQETEADTVAVRYLQKANIDPRSLADFLTKLTEKHGEMPEALKWISTHPASHERASQIKDMAKQGSYTPVMADSSWKRLQAVL